MGFTKPYSDETANVIDAEVKRIVNEQYERAKQILREYAAQHNRIRDLLVEKEVIFHDDVEKILGKRKWKSRTDEIIEINRKVDATRTAKTGDDDPYAADFDHDPKPAPASPAKAPDQADDDDDGTPPPFDK